MRGPTGKQAICRSRDKALKNKINEGRAGRSAGQDQVRRILPGEAAIITGIAIRSKAVWGYTAEFMQACHDELTVSEAELSAHDIEYWGYQRASVLLGFYAISGLRQKSAELEALFVEPGVLRAGIGRHLIDHAMERVRHFGAGCLVIQGDPHAEPFYLRVGAVKTGERASGSIQGRCLPLYRISAGDRRQN